MAESSFQISAVLSVGESNSTFVAWTSATAVNSTAILVNADFSYNTIVVSLNQTSTITGGVVTFQGSLDGVTWFNVEGASPVNGASVGPLYTLVAGTYSVFTFNLTAIPYFQILLSTAITGTATVTIGYSADSFVNTFFPIGSGSGSNASVGPNGSPIPSDSTLIGSKDASGNLQPASVANPIPIVIEPTSVTGNTPTNTPIGLSSVTVLASNANRKGVNVVNISFGTVSLAFGIAAVLYTGVTLGPGGTFWMDAQDFTTATINAISSQTNTTIAVQEFV
jgi:hypothetical protein